MKKLNVLGIGPKIGMITIPWFITTLLLTIYKKELFYVGEKLDRPLFILGIVLVSIGVIFYAITARYLLRGVKTTTLQTGGTYYLCQNPLYAGIILFLLPGISFLLHSWLILTTSVAGYIMFRINIHSEYREMEEFFGDPYLEYRKKTPEFWPIPWRKR